MRTPLPKLYNYICKLQVDLARAGETSVASLYHEQSKRWPNGLFIPPALFDPKLLPELSRAAFKEYPRARRIALAEPQTLSMPLERAILERRTIRSFTGAACDLQQVGTLLAFSYRIDQPAALDTRSEQIPKRPVPSGGALYPLELYVATMNVERLPAGLYHYHPAQHALEDLAQATSEEILRPHFLPASLPHGAAWVLCICGVLPRNRFKYGEFGYRLMLLEAGHLAQNALLVTQALGLGAMPCGGFYDDRMHDYLGVDGIDEVCLYVIVIGHPAPHDGNYWNENHI